MSIGPATYYVYYRNREKKAIGKVISFKDNAFTAIYFEGSNDMNVGTFDTLKEAHKAIMGRKGKEGEEARRRLKL